MPIPVAATFALQAASVVGNLFGGLGAARRQRRLGEQMAQDALRRGEQDVFAFRGDAARLLGRQRAVMAASGVDVGQGSAALIRQETEQATFRDMRQLRLNAAQEARAIRSRANATAASMTQQAIGSTLAAFPTLMTSGMDAWQSLGFGSSKAPVMASKVPGIGKAASPGGLMTPKTLRPKPFSAPATPGLRALPGLPARGNY